jgi:hypothetical protein
MKTHLLLITPNINYLMQVIKLYANNQDIAGKNIELSTRGPM